MTERGAPVSSQARLKDTGGPVRGRGQVQANLQPRHRQGRTAHGDRLGHPFTVYVCEREGVMPVSNGVGRSMRDFPEAGTRHDQGDEIVPGTPAFSAAPSSKAWESLPTARIRLL